MDFPTNFIAAGTDYSTLTHFVPAPYFRKSFTLDKLPDKAEMLICGLGFYDLFINGKRVTKGALAPYISNPDDLVYYDMYDLKENLDVGENVIGICLGNGFQNNPGGWIWFFNTAKWRGAPQTAFKLEIAYHNDDKLVVESDTSVLTSPSPIYFDDYRMGEYYDARNEQPGWCQVAFDDAHWSPSIKAPMPRGDARLCTAQPIVVTEEMKPVSVTAVADGYLYDFGINHAGIFRLNINGKSGQELTFYCGEHLIDGQINMRNIAFDDQKIIQKDIYICKDGPQTYTPTFIYHGFQYVFVKGMAPEQAVPEALTYLVMHSDLHERGNFHCSDEAVNTLQTLTMRSTLGNFHYFPTDCPHREKNGWTADAALSAEHMLINFDPEESFTEWMRSICKAQNDAGAIPGIVPTTGWGYGWGCGPAWDCIIVWLPYYTYIYRGDKTILAESANTILRYLNYLTTKIQDDGLLAFGMGDWCPVGRDAHEYKSPLYFTDTVVSMDICEKAAYIFGELGMTHQKDFAQSIYDKLYTAARARLLNLNTMTAEGNCQTSQSMAIHYNLFTPAEKPQAFQVLLDIIKADNNHMDIGVLGARVVFHVLADFGHVDLALKMITQTSFPSYGWMLEQGATSLWEDFRTNLVSSRNHHFWGDISHFFIRHLAGIHYNPHKNGKEVDIRPLFASTLNFAEGYHVAPQGEIRVKWERNESGILLNLVVPEELSGQIKLPLNYVFDDGMAVKPVQSGEYAINIRA